MNKPKVLVIDNYDSFVYNLVRYLQEIGCETIVYRNDKITLEEIERINPQYILLSPGPKAPKDAGICLSLIEKFKSQIPILGICLGHQAIGQALGLTVCKALVPMHGKASMVKLNKEDGGILSIIFKNIPSPLKVGRYHSLIVKENEKDSGKQNHTSYPIIYSAYSDEGEIMALECPKLKLYGVQFHPESILTSDGHEILRNFIFATLDA